ncbi:CBU_0592 family membrane protein [Phytohabitans suffuscus]|uniref:CBU-0592-like domain-containing protein n=1 Tax=Phytohabitans suffuscus TaxID=624315 RepID=A0A6F8YQM7_9ACTN|nr:hypothetical protein [Phytohabitans suffuscus]BCB88293.1 hypothetical protein Psuf_056060 [Phytohabitans suffuscus]
MTFFDLIEIGGSLLIVSAFAAAQLGRLDGHSFAYLLLNLTGSAVLAVIALTHRSWGFLLLEATWAVVSAVSLVTLLRRPRPRPALGAETSDNQADPLGRP